MAKNIVLLSDGTGNSASKLMKTNVWRVYEALDLTDPSVQVACYDDGVGTSSFKPLALLGGAFGVGLRRNVLRLYRFLCEHYDEGDRIYLFGFSRGAFTVRVLAGLICDQGIIRTRPTQPVPGATRMHASSKKVLPHSAPGSTTAVVSQELVFDDLAYGSELARLSAWAYRGFRRRFNQTGGLVSAARAVRDLALQSMEDIKGLPRYAKGKNHDVRKIDFIGVWDTVDAYGLPIDEMTDGVDRWVWPLSMPDLTLDPRVKRACHALALDDERNTFHPVLWDESGERAARQLPDNIRDERISQVWFAGMHSNVGGGYPDDSLSYVSLKWMTEQAMDSSHGGGLRFVPELLEQHTKKADAMGRVYDSRQGLKGYYRYNPRRIEWLTNGQAHEHGLASPTVTIPYPKVHESVFERISAAPEAYAPINLPQNYAVVMQDGRICTGDANPYETKAAAERRARAQEAGWDLVWQRRVVYFATVAATLYLLVQPLRDPVREGTVIEMGVVARLLAVAASFLPAMLGPWIRYYQAHPVTLVLGAAIVLLLMHRGSTLQRRICSTMRGIWLKVVPPARNEWKTLERTPSRLERMRTHVTYQASFAVLRRFVFPNVFGILILVWLAAGANRAAFEIVQSTGLWGCEGSGVASALAGSRAVPFASNQFCGATGVQLERGVRYRIAFPKQVPANWKDGGIAVTTASGVDSGTPGLSMLQRGVYAVALPFRRLWGADWFVPVARIGARGVDQYALDGATKEFTARTSGELFLFVNDAIAPLNVYPFGVGWASYYVNNDGSIQVTVTRLSDPGRASDATGSGRP